MKTMRKYIILIVILLSALSLMFFKNYNSDKSSNLPQNQQTGYEDKANLTIDFGNKEIKSFEIIINNEATAFSVLKNVAEKENISLQVKQYDFGVFVEKIGDFESTAKKSWIYYINGESGQVAADQQKLKNGDKVEWKYETPKL